MSQKSYEAETASSYHRLFTAVCDGEHGAAVTLLGELGLNQARAEDLVGMAIRAMAYKNIEGDVPSLLTQALEEAEAEASAAAAAMAARLVAMPVAPPAERKRPHVALLAGGLFVADLLLATMVASVTLLTAAPAAPMEVAAVTPPAALPALVPTTCAAHRGVKVVAPKASDVLVGGLAAEGWRISSAVQTGCTQLGGYTRALWTVRVTLGTSVKDLQVAANTKGEVRSAPLEVAWYDAPLPTAAAVKVAAADVDGRVAAAFAALPEPSVNDRVAAAFAALPQTPAATMVTPPTTVAPPKQLRPKAPPRTRVGGSKPVATVFAPAARPKAPVQVHPALTAQGWSVAEGATPQVVGTSRGQRVVALAVERRGTGFFVAFFGGKESGTARYAVGHNGRPKGRLDIVAAPNNGHAQEMRVAYNE